MKNLFTSSTTTRDRARVALSLTFDEILVGWALRASPQLFDHRFNLDAGQLILM